ncbi:MAG: hypothetical protein AB1497_00510 [Bacillota bacterium]
MGAHYLSTGISLLALPVAALLHASLTPVMQSRGLTRINYRGRPVPYPSGVVIILSSAFSASLAVALAGRLHTAASASILAPILVGLAGLVDDLFGSGDKGFRGHIRALLRGTVTTGVLKMAAGFIAGVFASSVITGRSALFWLPDAVLFALAVNLVNLLDLRPGRGMKAFLLVAAPAWLFVCAFYPIVSASLFGVAGVIRHDLSERSMMGDTGANFLGGVVGLLVLSIGQNWVRMAIFLLLLFLNALSEMVSFSAIIQRNAVLRWLDELGRHK